MVSEVQLQYTVILRLERARLPRQPKKGNIYTHHRKVYLAHEMPTRDKGS